MIFHTVVRRYLYGQSTVIALGALAVTINLIFIVVLIRLSLKPFSKMIHKNKLLRSWKEKGSEAFEGGHEDADNQGG